ncbi:hypothetical protein LTR37_021337 [Vermiconidia calcicola]|uniref:Uncharacterized protein n=1 Tax=Vermiconidia calcicola TaxID=1690605 RepID=A0ACC3M8Z6_9PEZI|nr:hypothetical protein LTR37_021337 [Vermiconidia calcicola]
MSEVVRIWLNISAARRNTGKAPITISGTDEVIPSMTFAIYNTTETHFSDTLYPDPTKFDPERHLPDREEYKQETYGYLGWGQGQKPCRGFALGQVAGGHYRGLSFHDSAHRAVASMTNIRIVESWKAATTWEQPKPKRGGI